ncbi:MAG: 4-hydroxy-3-methylbut-2-enyl diphosphate reductase [Lachnospiraceae bacterium]|nr:4-hydroxy-3-methylbut-2-enyl diphosphate reductase [Lachnospiraceae bacterium]
MEVRVAKSAGFCFGVKKAVEAVYQQLQNNTKHLTIYTYGPLIHNEEVVRDLEAKGVRVLNDEAELEKLPEGIVVLRSHGVEKRIYKKLEEKNLKVVDTTCPFVKKIHQIVEKYSEEGYQIVVIGNDKHPEVEGIKGWCVTVPVIIENEQQAESFVAEEGKKVCIVSQTTFSYTKFKDLVEIISKKGYDIIVRNTICNATEERQTEAKQIASEVDAMIVIGGKSSSNTQKLYEICKKECENTYYIQTLVDLDFDLLKSMGCVGITAGASTPNNIIEEVHTNVRVKF